jgi:hypothetical protein
VKENRKPLDFNWVHARERCSLKQVFEDLRLGIREDVKTRNASLPTATSEIDNISLKVAERSNIIRIFWDDSLGSYRDVFVEFDLTQQGITVKTNESTLFQFVVGLNDDGDCKLKFDGKDYDPWQVRMKTLEQLMFKTPR